MNNYVLGFQDIDKSKLPIVGGKGANLGELSKISGIMVPEGFCITTNAYRKMIGDNKELSEFMDQLSLLKVSDREKISELSGKIRSLIEASAMDKEIENEIIRHLQRLGEDRPLRYVPAPRRRICL